MKKCIPVLFLFCGMQIAAFCQSPTIGDIADDVDINIIATGLFEFCGYDSVSIAGQMELIKSRHKNRPGNELAFQYLAEEILSMGYDTTTQQFSSTGKNLIAKKVGSLYPNQYFMICAHYDGMPSGVVGPAADDNASSCFAVMEAMRVFASYDFEYSVLFAFWDEEEQGLVGSEAYAAFSSANNDSLLCVFNMDAIAHDSDNDDIARVHVTSALPESVSYSDSIFKMNTDHNLGLNLLLSNPGATYSDHAAFWDESIPAILLIEDWDDDPNPGYHTANDDTSYFDWPYYESMVKLSVTSIASWAKPYEDPADTTLNIKDIVEAKLVTCKPNPTKGILNVTTLNDVTKFSIFNALGELVAHKTILSKSTRFDLRDLQTGMYYFIAESEGKRQRGEFVKQ